MFSIDKQSNLLWLIGVMLTTKGFQHTHILPLGDGLYFWIITRSPFFSSGFPLTSITQPLPPVGSFRQFSFEVDTWMPCMARIIYPPSGLYDECQVWVVIIYPWGHTTILLPSEANLPTQDAISSSRNIGCWLLLFEGLINWIYFDAHLIVLLDRWLPAYLNWGDMVCFLFLC